MRICSGLHGLYPLFGASPGRFLAPTATVHGRCIAGIAVAGIEHVQRQLANTTLTASLRVKPIVRDCDIFAFFDPRITIQTFFEFHFL